MHFAAIGVATANADCSSICQIGVVRFDGERVTDERAMLVNPRDYFDPFNVSLHKITEDVVSGCPVFPDIIGLATDAVADAVVVTHTQFVRMALSRACSKHGVAPIQGTWLDSAGVARRTWVGCSRRGYGLRDVCSMIGYEFREHEALEVARATGQVLLAAMRIRDLDVEGWLMRIQQPWEAARIAQPGNPEGALHGNVVVFTGALEMTRGEAAELAAKVGCTVGEGVTKHTTILVVGDQDARRLAGNDKSAKHRKAEDLVRKGQAIKIITERDFKDLMRWAIPATITATRVGA